MKLRFLAGAAVGYLLGTRAGRQRYEQILGSLRDLTDSDLARQIKGEVTKLTGATSGDAGSSSGLGGTVTPPVIVGPAPDGKTGTADTEVALPDLEPSSATDTPNAGDSATRLDPPTTG
jgi:hypothetical protein